MGPSDGLDEYGEDFRHFEKPDDRLIGEILHRRKRSRPVPDPAEPADEPPRFGEGPFSDSKPESPGTLDDIPVRMISDGVCLIVGSNLQAVLSCGARLDQDRPFLMVVEGSLPQGEENRPQKGLVFGLQVAVRGHLGNFRATARVGGETVLLSRLVKGAPGHFDLVLDLRPARLAGYELPPAGYFVPDGDPEALCGVLAELPEMVGVFERPRFVGHDPGRCAHVRSGFAACGRCIESCPGGALAVSEDGLAVDHRACVCCGVCATVCPTGAMQVLDPPPHKLLETVCTRLAEFGEKARTRPTLIFEQLQEKSGDGNGVDDGVLRLPVAAVGAVGPEVWLAALAFGAARVMLRVPVGYPERLVRLIGGQTAWASHALSELGMPPERIVLASGDKLPGPDPRTPGFAPAPAADFPFHSKRGLIRRSIRHLAGPAAVRGEMLSLPKDSPFGAVAVNRPDCTLCMACAGACPTGALVAAGDTPSLLLTESRCIQCGQCRKVCPEKAVSLLPRLAFGPGAEAAAALHEEEALACICCGKAFAPAALVEKMLERLRGHPMYGGAAEIRRLKMCRDCRIRDYFQAPGPSAEES